MTHYSTSMLVKHETRQHQSHRHSRPGLHLKEEPRLPANTGLAGSAAAVWETYMMQTCVHDDEHWCAVQK